MISGEEMHSLISYIMGSIMFSDIADGLSNQLHYKPQMTHHGSISKALSSCYCY